MPQINFTLAEETALALKLNPEKLEETMRLAAAIKLYELGKLSSGAAATLAGIPKVVFLSKLAEYGVDNFDFTEEELREDFARA